MGNNSKSQFGKNVIVIFFSQRVEIFKIMMTIEEYMFINYRQQMTTCETKTKFRGVSKIKKFAD